MGSAGKTRRFTQPGGERRGRNKHKRKGRAVHAPSEAYATAKRRKNSEGRRGGISFVDLDFGSIKKYKKAFKLQTRANASKDDMRESVSASLKGKKINLCISKRLRAILRTPFQCLKRTPSI